MPDLDEVLSQLDPAAPVPEVDYEHGAEPQEFPPPVPAGINTFRVGKPDFTTKDGFIIAIYEHTVVGSEFDGQRITFDRVSTKPFTRRDTQVSFALDLLRSLGATDRPRTIAEWGAFFQAAEGRTFKGSHDWEAYCSPTKEHSQDPSRTGCGSSVKGMRSFPLLSAGSTDRNPQTTCACGNLIRANSRVTRYIPATTQG